MMSVFFFLSLLNLFAQRPPPGEGLLIVIPTKIAAAPTKLSPSRRSSLGGWAGARLIRSGLGEPAAFVRSHGTSSSVIPTTTVSEQQSFPVSIGAGRDMAAYREASEASRTPPSVFSWPGTRLAAGNLVLAQMPIGPAKASVKTRPGQPLAETPPDSP
ncbi:hypothetical protein GGTG_06754 [Gaeumannomyces tritici R3-111a-1]|uniref:Secreted protein n=1 Tax=Gaeumannomyces tritici (strain R3-111a-1) TaxID=644352 RepID=J3NZQ7_GAET3|nr:hypothetical protein GGTG_06754 [Gaeumannomyces tritici R3-111a-1]EJT76840.1 hypothetical protein GGTG_06754 [Gaeumannomyces tritici R3-111a-1]